MTYRSRAETALLATLAGACSSSSDSRAADAAADSAAVASSPETSGELRVSGVMIGRRLGPGNRITEPTFEFAPADTVHLSVATAGAGEEGALTAAWRSQSGEILQQSSAPVGSVAENAAFSLSRPKGLKPGTYKVVLFLGADSVDTKVFVVRK